MYLFVGLLAVLCMNQIHVFWNLNIYNFSINIIISIIYLVFQGSTRVDIELVIR